MFEELEGVESELRLGDLQVAAEDGGGFVLNEEEGTVGVVFGDFLEETEEVCGCEEEAGGVGR